MKRQEETNGISGVIQDLSADSKLGQEQKGILEWLEKVRFRKRILGGIKEEDVWEKIDELNSMYQVALNAERIRYDTMLEHYREQYETKVAKGMP
ncbi:MAG TPA: hypothetical protein VFD57_02815 [Clostridia bacterium]|nr:hypothetical protein [Clostridia bacterium]